MSNRNWYRFTAQAQAGAPAELYILSEIGPWGMTASECIAKVQAASPSELTVRINSPGGDVFEGLTIFHFLRSQKFPVHVIVDGVAASIASLIAMAGQTVTMNKGSMLMIHNPSGLVNGEAEDFREMAEALDKMAGSLADVYAGRTGKSREEMLAVMNATTWLTAEEAVAQGFATAIADAPAMVACLTPGRFLNQPKGITAELPEPVTQEQVDAANAAAAAAKADAEAAKSRAAAAETELAKRDAESVVAQALQSRRITAESAPVWVARLTANKADSELLATLQPHTPPGGAPPIPPPSGVAIETAEIRAQFKAMKPGAERSAFYSKYRTILL